MSSIPLYKACEQDDVDLVKELLDTKQQVHPAGLNNFINAKSPAKDTKGYTGLHFACLKGNPEIVEILLNYKANYNLIDDVSWKPIHCAAVNGYTEIVELLIKAQANPEDCTLNGYNSLHYARYIIYLFIYY
eukprot:TRINITY_DN5117_c0_g1_i1.p1 TRINITY_DN5117_c0_g1~~TRINITY_DN5117_c0_g1_i1.p1  ORF type:complete len:152 (+),score=32.09 TRINITY_DN5117_c0_g1_i1:61-456(+)